MVLEAAQATLSRADKFQYLFYSINTVDGRNPAPPGMYKTLIPCKLFIISTGAGFLPSTVCHQYFSFPFHHTNNNQRNQKQAFRILLKQNQALQQKHM